jgi:peroxiredoxin
MSEGVKAMRADMKAGAKFPDYQLPDHTGTPRRMSELQGEEPMIIVLAREAYSAKDQRQQQGLAELWREMKPGVGYCQLVTITTSDPQETFNYRSGVGAEWPFLADPGRIVQRDLDIAEYTDPIHNQMVPHTIVCEPNLIVYKIYNGYWFLGRPTLEEGPSPLMFCLRRSGSCPRVRNTCPLRLSSRGSAAGSGRYYRLTGLTSLPPAAICRPSF